MRKIREIEQELKLLKEKKNELRETFRAIIQNVILESAKEKKLNRISKHIFTIKFSDTIGKPWSPSFYDWKSSAKILLEYLENIEPIKWEKEIQSLYDKRDDCRVDLPRKYYYWPGHYRTEKTPIPAEFVERILSKLK